MDNQDLIVVLNRMAAALEDYVALCRQERNERQARGQVQAITPQPTPGYFAGGWPLKDGDIYGKPGPDGYPQDRKRRP